jgi:hypothetical protein
MTGQAMAIVASGHHDIIVGAGWSRRTTIQPDDAEADIAG